MTDDELRDTLTSLIDAMRRDAWAYRARGDNQRAQDAERCATQLAEALARKESA